MNRGSAGSVPGEWEWSRYLHAVEMQKAGERDRERDRLRVAELKAALDDAWDPIGMEYSVQGVNWVHRKLAEMTVLASPDETEQVNAILEGAQ